MTYDDAQELHDMYRASSDDHDQVGCVCCCFDCDPLMDEVDAESGVL